MRVKIPFWATFLTFSAIVVLCALGSWQLQRLAWKTQLIKTMEETAAADPMQFEFTAEKLSYVNKNKKFIRGFAEGLYRHDATIYLGPRTHEGKVGYHVITPLDTIDNQIIMVNRGWIPQDMKDGDFSKPDRPLIVQGTGRIPEVPNSMVPENNPAKGDWYRLDVDQIQRSLHLGTAIMPYVLYAEEDFDYPVSVSTIPDLPNNHLAYAIFWFIMAAVLLVIYYLRFWHTPKAA